MLCCFLHGFTSSFSPGSPRWSFASRLPGSPCLTQCSSSCWFPLRTKWWIPSWNVAACCPPLWRGLQWGCSLSCGRPWQRVSTLTDTSSLCCRISRPDKHWWNNKVLLVVSVTCNRYLQGKEQCSFSATFTTFINYNSKHFWNMVLICQFLTNNDTNVVLLSMIYRYLAKSCLFSWLNCLYCVAFLADGLSQMYPLYQAKHHFPPGKGRKVPRGFIFPCRGEVAYLFLVLSALTCGSTAQFTSSLWIILEMKSQAGLSAGAAALMHSG